MNRKIGHRGARLHRRAPEVWREDDVLERAEIRMDVRLVLVHVEGGAGNDVILERPDQRRLVDDRSPRRVDQIRAALHARERFLVDQMSRFLGQGAV